MALVLHLRGRVDHDVTGPLRVQLAEAFASGEEHVVLELDDVEAIDVAGLGVLMGAFRYLDQRGGSLRLRDASPEVASTLRINGLGGLLDGERARRRLRVVS